MTTPTDSPKTFMCRAIRGPQYDIAVTEKRPHAQSDAISQRAVTGGEVGATSSLAPKIGPLGLSPKKVGDDIAKATQDWKGLRITVKLTIQNRQAAISVVPTASSLIIRALKEPPRDRKKNKNIKHSGNISFDDVLEVARIMRPRSMARELSGTVKEILGTARSVGCTVDGGVHRRFSDEHKVFLIQLSQSRSRHDLQWMCTSLDHVSTSEPVQDAIGYRWLFRSAHILHRLSQSRTRFWNFSTDVFQGRDLPPNDGFAGGWTIDSLRSQPYSNSSHHPASSKIVCTSRLGILVDPEGNKAAKIPCNVHRSFRFFLSAGPREPCANETMCLPKNITEDEHNPIPVFTFPDFVISEVMKRTPKGFYDPGVQVVAGENLNLKYTGVIILVFQDEVEVQELLDKVINSSPSSGIRLAPMQCEFVLRNDGIILIFTGSTNLGVGRSLLMLPVVPKVATDNKMALLTGHSKPEFPFSCVQWKALIVNSSSYRY
ncbi:large subunit ribosomal protein L12e [Clonorchis sinensis]|uniref:Large ribosomal subunit protein uL11 n=1 Tax=Clonorchis sinensis TaxID=79923 RepID=G7YCF3_CLOSI|nr:large subunit ribosomal protein L12e [Clonorchis sinensis]